MDVRLDIGVTAILGPNGAGKTTFLDLIATALSVEKGQLFLDGIDVASRAGAGYARRRVGYQFQDAAVSRVHSVRESVAYAYWLKRGPRVEARAAVCNSLTQVRLLEQAERPAWTLSGGQRKRLAIAQAIVAAPALLLLDEPTASLDPLERRKLLRLVEELRHDMSIIISTHDTRDLSVCDAVLVMRAGAAVYTGKVSEFENLGGPRSLWKFGETALEKAYEAVSLVE